MAEHAVGHHSKCFPRTCDCHPTLNVLTTLLQESIRCSGPLHADGRGDIRFSNGLVGKEVALLDRTMVRHRGQVGLVPISSVLLGLVKASLVFTHSAFLVEDDFPAACFLNRDASLARIHSRFAIRGAQRSISPTPLVANELDAS